MSDETTAYLTWLDDMRQSVRDVLVDLDGGGLNWRPLTSGTNDACAAR